MVGQQSELIRDITRFYQRMFYLLALIIKSENSLIRKTNILAWDQFHMHCGIDTFCITCEKLITPSELQYYVNLRANFNHNKFENFSIQFERQSIISIQAFFNLMGWKWPSNHFQSSECFIYIKICVFCLIHKVDFCLANVKLRMSKLFSTFPVNFIHDNKTHDHKQMFGAMIFCRCLALCFHHDSP